MEAGGNHLHLALAVLGDDGVHLVLHAARDENGSLVAESQRARVGNAGRIDLDLEAVLDLELVERKLVRRGRQRRRRDGRQLGVGDGRRHALLPRRWRLGRLLGMDLGDGADDQKPDQTDAERTHCKRKCLHFA